MTDEANKIVYALECCEQDRNCFECGSRCPYDGIGSHCDEKLMADAADLIKRLAAELEQVKRERDAAIDDMEYAADCFVCKHHYTERCRKDVMHIRCFEWRGVVPENSGGNDQ